jgi:ATP-binding cassette subfamily C (CFTR/MRP) protein 1
MSMDASRVDFAAGYCHFCWTVIAQLIIILVILVINIGPSALVGYGLLIFTGPIVVKFIGIVHRKRFKSTSLTDARVRAIQEILKSMRTIKLYAWEMYFLKKVGDIRESELNLERRLSTVEAAVNAMVTSLPIYASMLAFVTYSITGHALNPANIFSSIVLFNMMRTPLMFFPRVLSGSIDAWVGIGRMEKFLFADELEKVVVECDTEFAISVDGGDFAWEADGDIGKREKKEAKRNSLQSHKVLHAVISSKSQTDTSSQATTDKVER